MPGTSRMYNHFTIKKLHDGASRDKVDFSCCNYCEYKNRGRQYTTLKLHLSSKHLDKYQQYLNEEAAAEETKLSQEAAQTKLEQFGVKRAAKRPCIVYPSNHPQKAAMDTALTQLFACNQVAYRLVESKEFRELLQTADPAYQPPRCHKTIAEWVKQAQCSMKERLEKAMEDKPCVLTADIWSQRGLSRSFMGVTAVFFDKNREEIMTVLIGLKIFKHPHTAGEIKQAVKAIRRSVGIGSENVVRIITDNAANMIAAYKQKIIMSCYNEIRKEDQEPPIYEDANMGLEDELEEEEFEKDIDDKSYVDEMRELPFQLGCSAHKLALVAKNGTNEDQAFVQLEEDVIDLINRFKRSSAATEELKEIAGLGLASVAKTRWLYFYLVGERLLRLKEAVMNVAGRHDWTIKFSWAMLDAAVVMLRPIFETVRRLEQSASGTGSMLVPALIMIKTKLNGQVATGLYQKAARSMLKLINKYFGMFLDSNHDHWDPTFLIASMLSPQAAIRVGDLFDRGMSELKSYAKQRADAMKEDEEEEEKDGTGEEEEEEIEMEEGYVSGRQSVTSSNFDLFDEIPVRQPKNKTTAKHQEQWEKEFESYSAYLDAYESNRKTDMAKFWLGASSQYKELGPLVSPMVILPATSASSERAFSIASAIIGTRRTNLSPKGLEAEAMFKANPAYR